MQTNPINEIRIEEAALNSAERSRWPAFFCASILLLCALATLPVAEIGMDDDWSYIQSARVLAQTGHLVYNGWATAMLGWQLYLGALFIRLFGASFTAIRASTLLVALVTAFLSQRTMVRAGLSSRNATIGTLSLVLSPLFLPLALTFMSDIGGLFCIVLCLYACLRALQAEDNRCVLAWLVFAASSNVLDGTIRQVVWLGVLVIVPCTIWLLRKRPHIVFLGVVLYPISIFIILGFLHWFSQQPYSVPTPLLGAPLNQENLQHMALEFISSLLKLSLFLLPVLIAYTRSGLLRKGRLGLYLTAGGALCALRGCVLMCVHIPISLLGYFIVPYQDWSITVHGLVDGSPLKGLRPVLLAPGIRFLLTAAVLFALLCFIAFLLTSFRARRPVQSAQISWKSLLILLVPFCLAYLALLLSHSLTGLLFSRYLLPIFFIGILLLLRIFQDRVQLKLPIACYALLLLYAGYAVAGTHDAFSSYRARQSAVAELRAAGIPATSIDGGFEQNGMTQIELSGYMNDKRIRVPRSVYVEHPSTVPLQCQPQMAWLTPAIEPGYTLSYDPEACGGLSHFAPVTYRTWLGVHNATLYIVPTVKIASDRRSSAN